MLPVLMETLLGDLNDEPHREMLKLYISTMGDDGHLVDFDDVWPPLKHPSKTMAIQTLLRTCEETNDNPLAPLFVVNREDDGEIKIYLSRNGIMEFACLGGTTGSLMFVKIVSEVIRNAVALGVSFP